MVPVYSLRPGERADVDGCVALALLAAPERAETDWRASLLRDVESPRHHLVVAERGGAIVGYGRARWFEPEPGAPADTTPRGYYLTGVFVRGEDRGDGVGASLTEARLDWIGRRADEAWYFSNVRNAASIALRRRFDFEEVTRRFSYPGLGFDGGEGILFRLRLR